MGCFASRPEDGDGDVFHSLEDKPNSRKEHQKHRKTAGAGGKSTSKGAEDEAGNSATRRRVSFLGNVADEAEGRKPSRLVQPRSQSFVGADLHAIMDEHGMLNSLVSRQLSVMSHYSVHSESGSVMITPEQAKAPFQLVRLIGRGGFGNVYLGNWDGENVAIKVIAGNNRLDLLPEELEWEARKERMAQMEAVLMSAIHHPNIVNTYKVTSHSGDDVDADLLVERRLLARAGGDQESGIPSFEWHILMEYCDRGSLSKMLASFKLHSPLDSQTVEWHAWTALEVLKETVEALIFLHEHRIIHGDLKAANVLLASSDKDKRGWEAKVSDFGLSRVIAANCQVIKTHTFGTVTHMPPELLSKGRLLPSSDVYAFGVLLWEVYTGEKVFKQLSDSEVILAVVTKKARPIFPPDCPSRYRFLAEKCWAEMHELRPSLKHVLNELKMIQQQLCPNGPDSAPIPCRVFPTRQRLLEQYRQQLAAQQAAAYVQVHAQPHTSLANGSISKTRPPPKPDVLPLIPPKQVTRMQTQTLDKPNKREEPTEHSQSAAGFNKSVVSALKTNVSSSQVYETTGRTQSMHHRRQPSGANDLQPDGSAGSSMHGSPTGPTKSSPLGRINTNGSSSSALPSRAVSAANMPLHPSITGLAPKQPSSLKHPGGSKLKHQSPSPRHSNS